MDCPPTWLLSTNEKSCNAAKFRTRAATYSTPGVVTVVNGHARWFHDSEDFLQKAMTNQQVKEEQLRRRRRISALLCALGILCLFAGAVSAALLSKRDKSSSAAALTEAGEVVDEDLQDAVQTEEEEDLPSWYDKEWTNLVGETADEAEAVILYDTNNEAQVERLMEDDWYTADWVPYRVRIFMDTDEKVVSAPRAG